MNDETLDRPLLTEILSHREQCAIVNAALAAADGDEARAEVCRWAGGYANLATRPDADRAV